MTETVTGTPTGLDLSVDDDPDPANRRWPIGQSSPCELFFTSSLPALLEGCSAGDTRVVECELGPGPEWVKAARDVTGRVLGEWGLPGLRDDMTLVVSELVTNALQHGVAATTRQRCVRLRLAYQWPYAMCSVSDPCDIIPTCKEPSSAAQAGRGLQLVSACSRRWGWGPLAEGGKVVWALFR